jgi:spermidine synthase
MNQDILWEGDTTYGHYQVVDTLYDSRSARVLYSGDRQAAQSGVAKDDNPSLLFDYNQRMFELVTSLPAKRLLLIGGGVATLPKALLAALPDIRIDIVEPDDGLTNLAYRFFDLPVDERLRFFHTDGRTFLRSSVERYDVILIDAFVHTAIPKELRTVEAFQAVQRHLRPNGVAAMNVISAYHGKTSYVLREIYAAASSVFRSSQAFLAGQGYSLWLPQNFVLIAQDGHISLREYMPYDAADPPEVRPDDALHDEW